MAITRTVEIGNLTPGELASEFATWGGSFQAEFFAEVWRIAKDWPGAGWCMQSLAIVQSSDDDARSAISTLAAHLEPAVGDAPQVMHTGWSSPTLARSYHAIEKLRLDVAQPVESGIDETLRRALDAIETADCELQSVAA